MNLVYNFFFSSTYIFCMIVPEGLNKKIHLSQSLDSFQLVLISSTYLWNGNVYPHSIWSKNSD